MNLEWFKNDQKWRQAGVAVGSRIAFCAAISPFEYAKVLMQIGFEPIPPTETTTLFGKPVLCLPNIFSYVSYIKSVNGFSGCFIGFTPRLCGSLCNSGVHSYVSNKFKVSEEELEGEELSREQKQSLFIKTLRRDILASSAAIIVSQPFHVVAVRSVAQFVGRETKYKGMVSLYTIYKEEGILGWFTGLIPRLLGEIATVFFVSSITFGIKTYLITEEDAVQTILTLGVDFLVKNFTYPFHVIGVCMAVNQSGLKAGSPPLMPNYGGNWLNCWRDLSYNNQLKRGGSIMWRYHVPLKSPPKTSSFALMPEIPKYK